MQYEILRDVLVIVTSVTAILGALIGGLVFFLLRVALMKDITAEVSKYVNKECCKLRAILDVQLGVTYWMQKSYDKAIEVTKRALVDAEDILAESKVIFAKSNLGYYYAEKHKQESAPHRKEEAIELTKVGFEKYSPSVSEFQQPDWIDNYVFVKAAFVQTNREREEVIQLIDNMISRGDLETIHIYLEESKTYVSGLRLTS